MFTATEGSQPERITNVSAARIRATAARDTRTLDRVEVRFDATVTVGETTNRVRAHVVHDFAVGVDVRRPAVLGPPRPDERVWKLLVY